MAYTTVDDPSVYFQTLLYTGNAGANRSLTNNGNSDLQPDWIWIKNRSADQSYALFDSSRGATKRISSNLNNAESTENTNLDSFDSDGFTIDQEAIVNGNGNGMVAWQWKANGGTATATASESGDNPAYSVQANTDAGFSIVTYTGTGADTSTVPHGLGAVPKMIIFKRRDSTPNWMVHHAKLSSATKRVNLNTTNAEGDASNFLDDTAPTSSVFTIGFSAAVNADGSPFVAYCFAPIKGYSSFGKYTGNGLADGPFVYTGFKPAWFMIKRTDAVSDWFIWDSKRGPINEMTARLVPNESAAEGSASMDFVSNGIKFRNDATGRNADTSPFIYMAFAESPFVTSSGVPTTAR